jgi:hypothetical protein
LVIDIVADLWGVSRLFCGILIGLPLWYATSAEKMNRLLTTTVCLSSMAVGIRIIS